MIKNINVALIGNPNTGKTSVFNALTGLNQKVGNYPGITVEKTNRFIVDDFYRIVDGFSKHFLIKTKYPNAFS